MVTQEERLVVIVVICLFVCGALGKIKPKPHSGQIHMFLI